MGINPKRTIFSVATSRGSLSSHADWQQLGTKSQQHVVAPWAANLDDNDGGRRLWWVLIEGCQPICAMPSQLLCRNQLHKPHLACAAGWSVSRRTST